MSHADATTFFALCAETPEPGFGQGLALNFAGDAPPEWIQVMPPGPQLIGNDGRTWRMGDPQKLVEAFAARGLSRPLDINHSTHLCAPRGKESPAAGWIEALEVRDGLVFARVDWTDRGRQAWSSRDYRYISPSFTHDAGGAVAEIVSAGLVNTPNFNLPALNSSEIRSMKDLWKKLGLPDGATENDAIAAVDALLTAQNGARPDLNLFVPRADYQLAVNRAEIAERALTEREKAARDAEVAALVEDAVKAGKIAPANRDFYLATCSDEGGLARFKNFIGAQPVLFQSSGVDDPARATGGGVALNSDQSEVALAMGIDPKKFAAFVSDQKKD